MTVIAEGRPFEVTTLRRDVETDGRHAVVNFTADWKEDAARRDFTMNALYCDIVGDVLDPIGGIGDLKAGRVRFIGSAEDRIREDYLRILRFFRFFAWYGEGRPDPDGLRACARMKSGIAKLSAERVWAELKRLLSAPPIRRGRCCGCAPPRCCKRRCRRAGASTPSTGSWPLSGTRAGRRIRCSGSKRSCRRTGPASRH